VLSLFSRLRFVDSIVPVRRLPLEFLSILAFFNHYSRNEPNETFFSNLALLSRVNPSSVTYKGVVPVHLP
jgi:hypothetical protein